MSVTHDELSRFTYRQLRQYTHDELSCLSLEELVDLATIKLDAVEKLPEEKTKPFSWLISGVRGFLSNLPLVLLNGAVEHLVFNVDWGSVLRSVIELLQSIFKG